MRTNFLFLLLFFPLAIWAQIIDFDFKSYQMPDLKRRELGLTGTANYRSSQSNETSNFNQTQIPITANYVNFRYSRKYMRWTVASVSGSYNTDRLKVGSETRYDRLNSGARFNLRTTHKYYPWENIFVEFDIDAELGTSRDKNFEPSLERESEYRQAASYQHVALGYGRIENLGDAQHAYFLVRYLSKNGMLKKDINNEELNSIAHRIAELKNERLFDSRSKRIAELQSLIEFLQTTGVIQNCDIKAIAQIDDIWSYGMMFSRSRGYSVSLNAGTRLNYNFENRRFLFLGLNEKENKRDYLDNLNRPYVELRGEYNLPINKNLQLNLSGKTGFSQDYAFSTIRDLVEETENKTSTENLTYSNSGDLGLTYMPNTRTNIQLSVGSFYEKKALSDFDKTRISTVQTFRISYYISPKIQIFATQNYSYSHEYDNSASSNQTKQQDFQIRVGFVYNIF